MEEHLASTSSRNATCATCGSPLHGSYCHVCGERVLDHDEFRLRTFLSRALHGVFDVDSRLLRSFRALLTRPGLLTAEYMAGRRRPYLHPLQVFLLANLVFFAALTVGGGASTFTTELEYHTDQFGYGDIARELIARHGAEGSPERAAFARRFDLAVPRYANTMVIVLAPVFAGLFALLHIGRRHPFVHHLVFALHFLAFMLLLLLVFPLLLVAIVKLFPALAPMYEEDWIFSLILLVVFALYLVPATRTAYGAGKSRALLVSVGTVALLLPAIVVYRMVLFFTVYLSLR